MTQNRYRATALSAAIAAALGTAPPTFAQDDQQIEEVIVTGSHIRRTEFEGRAPIQIVDAAAMEIAGAAQPVDVLKEITANSGSQFYNETNDRAGVSQFNIRNLGLGSTLTLLNGRRAGIAPVADDSGTDFVDINQFPLAMIERIEVLTDGASATYGSQAVGGVANIITRKGFEGFEISGGYATAQVDSWNLNLAAGSQFDQGGFNIYATYYEQDHIERSELPFLLDRLGGQGDPSRSVFLSSTGAPGTYHRATLDANGEAADVASADNFPDPDCEAALGVLLSPSDTFCRYDFADQVSVISAEERFQVFTEFDWNFSNDVRYYAEASFSSNLILRDQGGATLNTGRPALGGTTILPTHPFNFFIEDPNTTDRLVYIGPEAWDDSIHTAATIRSISRPLGKDVNNNAQTPQIQRQLDYRRIMQGLEFHLPGDWMADLSYGWSKSTRNTVEPHNYRSDIYQDQVRDGLWNPFGTRIANPALVTPKQACTTPGQQNCTTNPGATAGNEPVIQEQWDQNGVNAASAEEHVVDFVAAGDLFDIGSNTVATAVGVQWRQAEIQSVPDSLSAAGEANEQGIVGFVNGTQTVLAVFAEAIVPIGDMAQVQLAVRNEDYGGGVSTTDPKVSFEITPTEWLGVRGSWGTSFQAPTIRQTARAASSAFIADPASPTGPNGSLICNNVGLNNNITVTVEGAPDLQPQSADNYNLGLVFTFDRFRASVDYWTFDYTDLIGPGSSAQAIVDQDCSGDGVPNDPRVIRDAGGQLREVITSFENVGAVETDGIDINADYSFDFGNSSLMLDFGATYVNKFDVDSNGDGTIDFDGAGSRNFLNGFSTMPQWRGMLGATWLAGNHTANITARYIDGYENDQSRSNAANGFVGGPVPSWTTVDAQYSYVFSGLVGDGDTTLTVGVRNAFDEDPPALYRRNADGDVLTRINADGSYNRGWLDRPGYDDRSGADIQGRILYVRFKHAF